MWKKKQPLWELLWLVDFLKLGVGYLILVFDTGGLLYLASWTLDGLKFYIFLNVAEYLALGLLGLGLLLVVVAIASEALLLCLAQFVAHSVHHPPNDERWQDQKPDEEEK